MNQHHQLPCPTVVVHPQTHHRSAIRDLTNAIGPDHHDCPGTTVWTSWPLFDPKRRRRRTLWTPRCDTWMLAAYHDCTACPIHPSNHYATWLTYYTQRRLTDLPPPHHAIRGPLALGVGLTPRPRRTWPGGPEGHHQCITLLETLIVTARIQWQRTNPTPDSDPPPDTAGTR